MKITAKAAIARVRREIQSAQIANAANAIASAERAHAHGRLEK